MNYTEKYHLPQWEETDRIMRVDFNQMCADMEAGMSANAEAAAEAKTEALKLPYVIGNYIGTGEDISFTLGFKPSFVLIYRHQYYDNSAVAGNSIAIASPLIHSRRIYCTDQGFQIEMSNREHYPEVNQSGTQYEYIAFR